LILFSIITVNRNNSIELERTLKSVELHAPRSSEYIVIDGASTDGSVELIQRHAARISSWVSEPDSGIYCAMNKGIMRARGEFCLFLNSGDTLDPGNGLDSFVDSGYDIYYSDAVVSSEGKRTRIRYPHSVDANFFITGMINHQNALIRRALFSRIGLYDESYSICADWLFFLEAAYRAKISFRYMDAPIVEFTIGGVSSRPGSDEIKKREVEKGLSSVFGELSPTILEFLEYRRSIYGNVVSLFGRSPSLDFILKAYRFFARRIHAGRSPYSSNAGQGAAS